MHTPLSSHRNARPYPRGVAGLLGLVLSLLAAAGGDPLHAAPAASPWQLDLGVAVKESYDNNVYLSDVNRSLEPAGSTTLADRGSFITLVSPAVGLKFSNGPSSAANARSFSASYAPDIALYHELPTESYDAQRLNLALGGKTGAFSYNVENSLVYVDGSTTGPIYPGGLLNAWATVSDWQRRESLQDRAKLSFQYDWNQWFIRPGAAVLYLGMKTQLENPALASTPNGYQNYPVRSEVSGGLDVGRFVSQKFAITLGYRYGAQHQEQFSFSPDSASNDYQRVLLGLEGRPLAWLNVQFLAGPDFRSYSPDTATHISPLYHLHPVTHYGEAVITATISPRDSLTFKYKEFQNIASTGKCAYFDSNFDLTYGHKFSPRLSFNLGAKLIGAKYTMGNLSTSLRDDVVYTLSAAAHYGLSPNLEFELGYLTDLGRNILGNVPNAQTRDFDRRLFSLGVHAKL